MSYIFYNPNPTGKIVGDCVIRAITVVTGEDWETVYMGVVLQGFLSHDMPSSNYVWGKYLQKRGFVRDILPDTCPDCYTVKQFCRDYPNGEYLLATGSHVIAIVDGNYYDAWDSGSEIPVYYWRRKRER